MKRPGNVKFPNSVELFKFCQKVLDENTSGKTNDQEVGQILDFNPSDCSHWKRGEKNVRSVFALAKLSKALNVEETLLYDIAGSVIGLDEAYFEYNEAKHIESVLAKIKDHSPDELFLARQRVEHFIEQLHRQCDFASPPLYLPEVLRFFSFVTTQPVEMVEKLSRILRLKPGKYVINFRKGDLKPQTRLSMAKDLAKIIFEAERSRFPELAKTTDPALVEYEELVFVTSLLVPKPMFAEEMAKIDPRKNIVAELAALFWVPKTLVSFQIGETVRAARNRMSGTAETLNQANTKHEETVEFWKPQTAS